MELKKINTMEDVEKFLRYVMVDLQLGWGFHPDDDFCNYVKEDGTPTFSADEAQQLNAAIDRSCRCAISSTRIYTTLDYKLLRR